MTNNDDKARQKLAAAVDQAATILHNNRAQVITSAPFFGALLLRQRLVASTDVETMATNGRELFYNPDYVINQDADYLRGDVAHEALHPALCHHTRRRGRDFKMWNEACDYVINPIVQAAGFHMAPDSLFRDDLTDLSAERAYNVLAGERKAQQQDEGEPDPDSDDDSQGDDDSQAPPTPRPIPGTDDTQGGDDDNAAPGSPDGTGNGTDDTQGTPQPRQVPSIGGHGAVLDAPVETEAERQAEEADAKLALTQAVNFAESRLKPGDKLSGPLVRQVEAITAPRANWRELTRRYCDAFSKEDYTWQKPNRRFISSGLYLPACESEQIRPFLFVIDASLSMPNEALQHVGSELQSIMQELRPEFLDVIVHDTAIRHRQRFDLGEEIDLSNIRAGGGTKFAPVCDAINDSDEDYALAVWFTDLDPSDWHACKPPDTPVLWLDWTADDDVSAPFGDEVIALEDDSTY